jgi:hypothetical protein
MGTVQFHPVVQEWFQTALGPPTPAQHQGWTSIAAGRHTLIAAPTGSGKTLAAFLTAIDRLFTEGLETSLADEVQVLYISPLKALSTDIHKNLEEPREGIARIAAARGLMPPRITAGGPHRRHSRIRARGHGEDAAAHPGHDARIALPAADLGAQPADAADGAYRDRGRDPRGDRHAAGEPIWRCRSSAWRAWRNSRCSASGCPPRRSRSKRWRAGCRARTAPPA